MAATTQSTSSRTEPFPALDLGPRTPTSLSSSSNTSTNHIGENPNLIGKREAQNLEVSADISPKSGKRAFSPSVSPLPLTGAAAMAELRKRKQQQQNQQRVAEEAVRETSPNPAMQAVQSLLGASAMSRPTDAPAPDKLSEPLQRATEKMRIPSNINPESTQASPTSMSSFGTVESAGHEGLTATAGNPSTSEPQFVAEPAQMTEPVSYTAANGNLTVAADQDGHKAFSYPGPPPQDQSQDGGPTRGMSLPGYGHGSPKSPASNKRHKCPYCSTDFTRHHNLKSHLLTHSQEKPYVCQTCQARFRRLHDLKRHTKLHTGERPHTCDKCGRRFARGDALARHNKGPGGCAGRRSSFGGDDDYGPDGGEGMDGVEYGGADDDSGSSPDGRRGSEPSRKRVHLDTHTDPNRQAYRQQSSTYPPVQTRPHAGSIGSMGPPQVVLPGANPVSSPREMSNHPSPAGGPSINSSYYGGGGQVFPQQGMMTESPKPLSPGQPPQDAHRLSVGDASTTSTLRNRSPSLTTQFQQAHFGRGSGRITPPAHPPQYASHHPTHQVPVLPPLGSQASGRPGLQPSSIPGGPGPSMLHHQQVPPPSAQGGGAGSNGGSLSSHGRSSGSSLRDHLAQDGNDLWAYVRSLEQRFSRMQDEYELRISRLQEEVISLKGQMSAAASYSSAY